MKDQLSSSQNSDLNNDLAMCIDNNDNQMTPMSKFRSSPIFVIKAFFL